MIIAVYVLMDKRRLLSQTERLLEAVFGKKVSSKVTGVTNLLHRLMQVSLQDSALRLVYLPCLCLLHLAYAECHMPDL